MLVLMFTDSLGDGFARASELRAEIERRHGPTVWLDAISVASERARDGVDEMTRTIIRVMGAAIDSLEPASWRVSLVTIPSALEQRSAELAFWWKRKAFSTCYSLIYSGTPGAGWAIDQAEAIARDGARTVEPRGPAPPRIETERLVLTIPRESHAQGYFDAIVGTSMFDTLVWEGPKSPAELAEFVMLQARDHARGSGAWTSYGVIEKSTDSWIGTVGTRPGDRDSGRYTLGYNLAVSAHGKGYGTEAIGAVVRDLFTNKKPARIDADVFVGNDASRRVLEKLGFTCEATLKSMYPKRAERRDAWVYSLLRSDWERCAEG